jgi:hypothetical protein
MATQLRLVDPPPAPERRPSRAASAATARPAGRVGRATRRRAGAARRAASWGEWELDARTRSIGKAGVAAARAALERAAENEGLPRAS